MAVVYTTSTTSSTIKVNISGMNTYLTIKHIVFDIKPNNVSEFNTVHNYTGNINDGTYSYTYTGLNASTTYTIAVIVQLMENGQWVQELNGYYQDDITTLSGGGGGQPSLTASSSGSTINAQVIDYNGSYQTCFYLYDDISLIGTNNYLATSGIQSNQPQHSFFNISNSTYYVYCEYRDNINYDNWIGLNFVTVTIGGGGGGDSWVYTFSGIVTPIPQASMPVESIPYLETKTGIIYVFELNENGTITFASSQSSGISLVSYFISSQNITKDPSYDPSTSYNSATGEPYSYDQSDTGQFYYSSSGQVGDQYVLYVTSSSGSGSFLLTVDFTPSVVTPNFSCSVSGLQLTINLSNMGDYYFRYFVRRNDDSLPHAIISDNPLQYQRDSSKVIQLPDYSREYAVNVGYSERDVYQSGELIWIRPQGDPYIITTGAAPVTNDGKVYIYTGSGAGQGWKLAKPYIFTGTSWQPASAYIFNGSQWKITKS